jgi:hypothetical protein
MVAACMVFTLVIRKIFLSRMRMMILSLTQKYLISMLRDRWRLTVADGGRIVAMNWVPRLRMAEFLEGESKNHALFAIEEEGPEFGFCSGCDDET